MTSPRATIVRALEGALEACDPVAATRGQVIRIGDGSVEIAGVRLPADAPIDAFAVGKAAGSMMLGLLDALGERLRRGFVLTKDDHTSDRLPKRVTQAVAAHPVLDERSLEATAHLLDWLAESSQDGVVVCLLSGGGSALLELPTEGVSLEEFQQVTTMLLQAGADIYQLNAVRSQISQVKGGRLRRHIPSTIVVNLILSDVLGNDVSVIASGPTVRPVSTPADALAVLARLELTDQLPASVRRVLEAGGDHDWHDHDHDRTVIVADNEQAMAAAAASLQAQRFVVQCRTRPGEGEASDHAREWVRWLASLPASVSAAIGGGELTVTVRGDGAGGRNTEFALAAALELERLGIADWTLASLATDGDDALTGVAGAIVDGDSARRMRDLGHDPFGALGANDSLAPLAAIGATHVTGPTGTNVNDLYIAVRR